MKSKKQFKWRSPLSILCLVSVSQLFSVKATEAVELPQQPQLIAIDVIDAIQGAIQYIQVANISDEQEVAIGKQTNEQILEQYPTYDNASIQEYVTQLGQELVSNSNSRDIPFNFQVVASDEVNAFAIPGGYVYVTTGLLKAADNRAQLASVLAHEIAHINEKHGVKNLKQAVAARGIASTVGVDSNTLAQIAYQLTVDLPQSRSFEYEADSSGLEILQQSGYPAEAFANFLTKLQGGGGTPEFLRTHPSSDNRIEAISQNAKGDRSNLQKGQDNAEYRQNVLSAM